MKENTQDDKKNVYAQNIKGETIHISKAESGKKGYYCIGCTHEMQAKKGDFRTQHFSHDPKDALLKGKCTFSDETVRHKIAKDILQILKRIKVPALYKYPPDGIDGRVNLIKESWFIEAHSVRIELPFFENAEGEIEWGKRSDANTKEEKIRELLIQPDISFFDKNNKPILLIEVVATHKIDTEKLLKIRRLGINTVEVTIPKGSPEEIENTFLKTERTKWIYNYERENTEYIFLPKRNDEGVLLTDEFERKLLKAEESYECKASQLRNLIRGFTKCLASESYRRIEQSLNEELRRVEGNTERERRRLHELQDKYRREIRDRFESEENQLGVAETIERGNYRDLETRYFAKEEVLTRAYRDYKSPDEHEIDTIEKNLEFLAGNSETGEYSIGKIAREEKYLEDRYRTQRGGIESEIIKSTEELNITYKRRENLSEKYGATEREIIKDFERRRKEIRSRFDRDATEIRTNFERIRQECIRAIESGNLQGIPRFEQRNRELLNTKKNILSIREGKSCIEKLNRAKQFLESESFKNWK